MINKWAHFLAEERLTPKTLGEEGTQILLVLAEALAKTTVAPRRKPFVFRKVARRTIVSVAMDLGIDLPALTTVSGKVAMGRGLLDMWSAVYKDRFGSDYGTNAWFELKRRGVVTKLAKERH